MTEEEALEKLKEISGYVSTGDYYSDAVYSETVGEIVKEHPELANQVLNAVKFTIQSDKNDSASLSSAYYALEEIVKNKSDLAEQVFDTFKVTLQSEKNSNYSLSSAYEALRKIVKSKPDLAEQVLDTVTVALQSDTNNYYSLSPAYYALEEIVKNKPDLAEQVFDTFKVALQSDKNSRYSLLDAYRILGGIATSNPDLAEQAFDTFKVTLQSEENDRYFLIDASDALSEMVKGKPELAEKVLNTINFAVQSDNRHSLTETYETFCAIVKSSPDLAEQVFDAVKVTLQSDKNGGYSLKSAYGALSEIVKSKPDLAEQVFDTVKIALQSDENDSSAISSAYVTLDDIIKNKPDLTEQVLDALKLSLQSDKNDEYSLSFAYDILGEIAKSKSELAEQVFDTVKFAVQSDKNDKASLSSAYEALGEIAKSRPELAEQMSDTVKVVGKLKRLTEEELNFVLRNMNFEQMAEEGKLSVCQKCLNVMIGQMDKENGGDGSLGKNRAEFPNSQLYKNNTDWLIPSAYAAAEVFGAYLPNYLKKMESVGVSVHDAVYFLPYGLNKEDSRSLGEFLQEKTIYVDNQKQKHVRPSSELGTIAKNWSDLKQDERKLPYTDVLKICQSKKYAGQKYAGFAVEAANAGIGESQYKELEAFYEASLKTPCPFDTTKEFKCGNLTGRFLPRDDPRTGFFGEHTNCCQHFGGVGGACAKSSMIDAWSQLFVIEKDDGKGGKRIVAGSWMWENEVSTDGKTYKCACADNIEAIGDYCKNPAVNSIYEAMADYLTKENGYRKVTAGVGYQDAAIDKYQETTSVPLPKIYGGAYSDAKTQVLISENKKAPAVDTKQESLRFIRKACRDDFKQMQKVADECFPDGDQALQIPEDDFNGFVLVDKYKGVQGYVLYDKEEKHIYDMAVMPEYRTDKNASSSKLLGEMIKEVKRLGGEWSAEARENTSLRFLKAWSARGLCALNIGEVDHVMDDGTKVYSVTFTPQRSEPKVVNKEQNSPNMQNEANNQSNSFSAEDKVKKAFELSGRGGAKPAHAISADEKAVMPEQGVQNNNANASQVKTEPQTSSAGKVADVPEKGKFFHKLRMGINTILRKKEQDGLSVQPMSKTQTNIQQSNIVQRKISNDKGNGR